MIGGLTRGGTRREAGFRVRRPSRLDLSKMRGVTAACIAHIKGGSAAWRSAREHVIPSRG